MSIRINNMTTPEQLVNNFIIAYKQWNDNAIKSSDDDMDMAEKEYADLINRFCSASVVPQGIAFGSDSSHSPDEETIIEVSGDKTKTIVKTKHIDDSNFISDYEYILENNDGNWLIRSLLYIDADGSYECL